MRSTEFCLPWTWIARSRRCAEKPGFLPKTGRVRTAVDSSVLLDVLSGSPRFGPDSRESLRRAAAEGSLVACEVVWAEARAHFASLLDFHEAVTAIGIGFDAVNQEC